MTPVKVAELRRMSELAEFDEVELRALAAAMTEGRYTDGELLVRKGDRADGLFIILGGKVDISVVNDGKRQLVATLQPGESFGHLALVEDHRRRADVEAVGEVRAAMLSRQAFDLLYWKANPTSQRFQVWVARQLARDGRRVTDTLYQVLQDLAVGGDSLNAAASLREVTLPM
jgi:CRP-like cAMP-binding protein